MTIKTILSNFFVKLLVFPALLLLAMLLCFGYDTFDPIALSPIIICYVSICVVLIYSHHCETRPKIDRIIAGHRGKNILWGVAMIFCFPFVLSGILFWFGVTSDELATLEDKIDPTISWSVLNAFTSLDNKPNAGSLRGFIIVWEVGMIGLFLFSGIAVPFIVGYLEQHKTRWEEGRIYYTFRKKKYIAIIGSHETISSIIKQAEKKYREVTYFIVFTDKEIEHVRNRLSSELSTDLFHKVIFYHGNRNSIGDLSLLIPSSVGLKAIYIIGENDENGESEDGLDSKNLQCARIIASLCSQNISADQIASSYIDCYLMFENNSAFNAFIKNEIPVEFERCFNFTPFNFYELWSEKALTGIPNSGSIKYSHIDRREVWSEERQEFYVDNMGEDSCNYVHIVVVGMSRMGLAIAKEAALICHYPNFAKIERQEEALLSKDIMKTLPVHSVAIRDAGGNNMKSSVRTRITFIDVDAENQKRSFFNRNKMLGDILSNAPYDDRLEDVNYLDVEWNFIQGNIDEPEIQDLIQKEAANKRCMLTLAICLPTDDENITAASFLPKAVYENAMSILVHQRRSKDIVELMSGKLSGAKSLYNKLEPFGMIDECFDHHVLDYNLAKLIHYCKDSTVDLDVNKMNWHGKRLLVRWSSVYSSHSWLTKLRSMNIDIDDYITKSDKDKKLEEVLSSFMNELVPKLEDRDLLGRTEHNRWIMERILIMGEEHRDICSFWQLLHDHPEVIEYDINRIDRFVRVFPTYARLRYENNR